MEIFLLGVFFQLRRYFLSIARMEAYDVMQHHDLPELDDTPNNTF